MSTSIIFILLSILLEVFSEAPPLVHNSISYGTPYQDNSKNGIDIAQLLASAGERLTSGYSIAKTPSTQISLPNYNAPPQVQEGYNAPPLPQQNYGPPQQQVFAAAPPPSQSYGAPTLQQQPQVYAAPAPQQEYGAPQQQNFGVPSTGYGVPNDNDFVIKRQISIHLPPPELEQYPQTPRFQQPVYQKPEKHYRIIFIKAPSPPAPSPADFIPPPPQPEQKTLVYVLVKKPDPPKPYTFPTFAPTTTSKPEVYFIRYTGPQEPNAEYGVPDQLSKPEILQTNYEQPQPVLNSAPAPVYNEPVVQQTYNPPIQQSYSAPVVQQAYSPPTVRQQIYNAPAPVDQQTYNPPVQQAYNTPSFSLASQYNAPVPAQSYATQAYSGSSPAVSYAIPEKIMSMLKWANENNYNAPKRT